MTTMPRPTLFATTPEIIDRLPWRPLAGCSGVTTKTVHTGEQDVAGLLRFAAGAEEVQHLHGHGEHHVWVLSGTVVIQSTELPAGSYLHVPPGVPHSMRDTGSGSTLFYVFRQTG